MELARVSVPLPPPASPAPLSPLTISIPARIPAPAVVSTAATLDPAVATKRMQEPEVTLQQLEYDEDGEDTPPIEHYTYTYQDPSKVAVQTQVFEPESPSPILAAWPSTQLNPDYLAPYHPSLHKNIHSWSQILLDQVRQKSGAPLPADHTQHSVGDTALEGETAKSGASFQGVSVGTTTSSARDDAIKVEKHFLFQTHHRSPHSKHGPHSSKTHPIRPRHQIHARRASERSTRTFRSLVHFLQRLLRALKRRGSSPVQDEEDTKLKEANPSSSTPPSPIPPPLSSVAVTSAPVEPSDGSLQYLTVSENGTSKDQESFRSNTYFTQASELEPQNSSQPKKSIANTATSAVSNGLKAIKDVPKILKFIDKIKSHAHHHPAEEVDRPTSQKQAAVQQGLKADVAPTTPKLSPAALAAAAQLEAMAEQKRNGASTRTAYAPQVIGAL